MGLIDSIWSLYLHLPKAEMERFIKYPLESQNQQLNEILQTAQGTEWGMKYKFSEITNPNQWRKTVPVHEYDQIKSDIHRMMKGQSNILWPGIIRNFAKSSGTTSDKSKFIPITAENHKNCYTRAGLRLMCCVYDQIPNVGILDGKSILLAGSTQSNLSEYPGTMIGDVSAVIYRNLSSTLKSFLVPDEEYNLLEDSEKKLDIIAEKSINADVRQISGSPTWMQLLFKKLMDISGKSNMLEIWPNFKILIHGAVSFVPYRKSFEDWFPSPDVYFFENYNASEGYFALQDVVRADDMLLLLDVGIFYEFMPLEEVGKDFPDTCLLDEVELNKNYAIIITSNSGLYRYIVGDTIQFTNLQPHRIKITGRIKQFINVFGEELMVANTDEALKIACNKFNVKVKDYTVGPVFQNKQGQGAHEWIIEFESDPIDKESFADYLDKTIQTLNSDYEAKRFKDLALQRLKLHIAKKDCFNNWMKATNRVGAQKKVPRLSNQRNYLEEILPFAC